MSCYFLGSLPFEKPKTEVYFFKGATLPSLVMREFTTKEDLNTKKQVLLTFKGCVHYIFVSSFLSLNESTCETGKKAFLFHLKTSFRTRENQKF